jgi:hypothetical protein
MVGGACDIQRSWRYYKPGDINFKDQKGHTALDYVKEINDDNILFPQLSILPLRRSSQIITCKIVFFAINLLIS